MYAGFGSSLKKTFPMSEALTIELWGLCHVRLINGLIYGFILLAKTHWSPKCGDNSFYGYP